MKLLGTNLSISTNMNIAWDSKLLSAFINKLDSSYISFNESIKWDIDLLVKFNGFWNLKNLSLNKIVWSKVFHQFETEEHLIPLLDLVLEKHSKDRTEPSGI